MKMGQNWCLESLALMIGLMLAISLVSPASGECMVESVNCTFPFGDEGHQSCIPGDNSPDTYFCYSHIGERHVYGQCNGGCFEEDGSPMMFNSSVGDDIMQLFCKTLSTPCIFPFKWRGQEYHACTSDGSEFPWCAVQVDDNNMLVDNRWGKCDMSTCEEMSGSSAATQQSKSIPVTFENIQGELFLTQDSPDDPVSLEGNLMGLDPQNGPYVGYLCDGPCESMDDTCQVITVLEAVEGEEFRLQASDWKMSLYEDSKNYVVGKVLAIKTEDKFNPGEQGQYVQGQTLGCTIIQESAGGIDQTLLIIIIVIVVVLLLILLLVICFYCCCKNRRNKKKKDKSGVDYDSIDDPGCSFGSEKRRNKKKKDKSGVDYDSIDDPIGNGTTKTPLYDELSIPFIDASLPPTPKIGRSTNQLDLLLGKSDQLATEMEEFQRRDGGEANPPIRYRIEPNGHGEEKSVNA